MESFGWILSFAALGLWLTLGIDLLLRPPVHPRTWTVPVRRLVWGTIWILALIGGIRGPELWARSTTDFPRDPAAGAPMERVTRTLQVPFVMQATTRELDAEARLVRAERRLAVHLPVGLMAFFALGLWLRPGRVRDGGAGGAGAGRALVAVGALACGGAVACSEVAPGDTEGPDRLMTEVRWDTLAHLRVGVEDTLLFSADQVAAGEGGFWVLDRTGHRVARFDWDGAFRWYAGRQGAGPGELMNPRVVAVDDREVAWVMDVGTARISGFGPDGDLEREVSLQALGGMMGAFATNRAGDRFFGVLHQEEVVPVSVDANGGIRQGTPLFVPEDEDVWGFAFQGMAAREPDGDRWVYAFSMGDGFFRMDGLERWGDRVHYPEFVPFPRMVQEVRQEGNRTITTRRLTEPNFSANSVAVARGRILVQFMGETGDRGRILDLFDLETGAYERSVLLPANGHIAAWEERMLLARNDPTPEILVLRMVE